MAMIRIFKFGGALLKNASDLNQMAAIVQEFACEPMVIVVSAMGKTTNKLERLLKLRQEQNTQTLQQEYFKLKQKHIKLIQSLDLQNESALIEKIENEFYALWKTLQQKDNNPYHQYDQVVSFGENFALLIVNQFLSKQKLSIQSEDARCLMVTNENHTKAGILWDLTERTIISRVSPAIQSGKIVVTQGFIGANQKGETTTLGREGSDFSAAILAYALQAEEVSIWKDVPGLMNCDPRLFQDAIKLPHISYNEAIELAFYGASVIHPKTIQPLQKKGIPLKVRSFYTPTLEPSLIDHLEADDARLPKIIVKQNQTLLSISSRNLDFMAEDKLQRVFTVFNHHKVHINLMQNSAVSFSVCFDEDNNQLEKLILALRNEFILKYNSGLQLFTFRHFDQSLVDRFTAGRKFYLSQKNRTTLQILLRNM
jgi:aspartate kinase